MRNLISRRDFLKRTSTSVAAVTATGLISACNSNAKGMPKRTLGKTGFEISTLTFGGGSMFLKNKDGEWEQHLETAIEAGVNIFDTASTYKWNSATTSEQRFGMVLPQYRNKIYLSTKFSSRNPDDAMKEIETSLKHLKTDYVDLLLMHSVEEAEDLDAFGDGVYKMMVKLKEQGITKNIGFSSMSSAEKSRDLINRFDIDACILAMNPTLHGHFSEIALPAAVEKNVGVIAMKVMKNIVGKDATAKELLNYVLTQSGVASGVVAHVGMETLVDNIRIVNELSNTQMAQSSTIELEDRLAHLAGPHALSWARPGYFDGFMC
jgi:uncharacterized protein